jgi:hypothetical protein
VYANSERDSRTQVDNPVCSRYAKNSN